MKHLSVAVMATAIALMSGCASVPMSDTATVDAAKSFPAPDQGNSGIYVYRNSFVGKALKKDIWVNGNCLGETADKVFFYTQVPGNKEQVISTESEFSPNDVKLYTEAGRNYFFQQSIKMGVFVGGAKLTEVPESEGRRQVSQLKMAQKGRCSK